MAVYGAKTAAAYRRRRRADPQITALLAAGLRLTGNGHYLDIGCGTGNYMQALAAGGGGWTGLDPSTDMLRGLTPNRRQRAICGRAETLPFAAQSFDGAIGILALHHFTDIDAALREAARILKRKARLAIFTPTREQAEAFWLADYLPDMMARDACALPRLSDIKAAFESAGFKPPAPQVFHVTKTTQDRFFYCGDGQPEIYLAAENRAAMSPFRLAQSAELQHGLARLSADIDSGAWHKKRQEEKSRNAKGHYMLMIAEKP